MEIPKKKLWTNKLDMMHIDNISDSCGGTYCGKPQLGNNYANYFEEDCYGVWSEKTGELPSRGMCEECLIEYVMKEVE